MTRKTISLNDNQWRFGSVSQKPFGDADDWAEVQEWLPAQIPGDVRLDLLRAGKISDPYFGRNNADSQWVDGRDWWYTRGLNLELQAGERAFLVFEGIDYQSAVFLDGRPLGRHVGMFSQQVYELSAAQSPSPAGAPRQLAVRIWGSDALPKRHLTLLQKLWKRLIAPMFPPVVEPFPDRYATVKCQMQFGWDFAPRLRTCGLWDNVSIIIARSVWIEDVWVRSKADAQSNIAHFEITLALDSDRAQRAHAAVRVQGKNFEDSPQTRTFELQLERGKQECEVSFDLPDARLWNPWDRGEPNLCELHVDLLSSDDEVLDSSVTTCGIRSLELVAPPTEPRNAEPWTFVVNGKREFLRGANWVPLDAIPGRLTREDYAGRLRQVREANINFLRVWGGGLREKRAFYDLCDELGILVWQEFPFAGAVLDRFPSDRPFLDLVHAEASAIVRALRNHPSLVVWCGGNEFNTRGNRAIVHVLQSTVARLDPTRPFKPASPSHDESHYWRVWHRMANLSDYRKDRTPFLSEFGLQALPGIESLKRFLPNDALYPPNPMWVYHNAEVEKLERYARPMLQGVPAGRAYGVGAGSGSNHVVATPPNPPLAKVEDPRSEADGRRAGEGSRESSRRGQRILQSWGVEDFIDATQRAQALGLQIAIEHMRRRKDLTANDGKGRAAAGVAVWQFNDPWPAISWSVVDYYGVPKRAYAELERCYSLLLASFDYPVRRYRPGDVVRGQLWLINDWCRGFDDLELRASLNETLLFTRLVSIASDLSLRLDDLEVRVGEGENILRLELREGTNLLGTNLYDLNEYDVGKIHPFVALGYGLYDRLMR